MKYKSMMPLEEDKIIEFRNRLYQKNVPQIIKSGSNNLQAIGKCKMDENGKIVIPIDDIVLFFFESTASEDGLGLDHLFTNLSELFEVLTKESENFSFRSDTRISENEIEEADNKKTIEFLTKNLILSYFKNMKSEENLLGGDLKTVITKSREGKDYQILVANTLDNLIQNLKAGEPWKEALIEIQQASVVCTLIGARLPQIEKEVLLKIVSDSREEIKENTAFFSKILDLKSQLIKEEKNKKEYLKKMTKIDSALTATLGKIDEYLSYAHKFIHIMGTSSQGFIGKAAENLKKNIARFFFGYFEVDKNERSAGLHYASVRYRIDLLFDYPDLTAFTGSLQAEEKYGGAFLSVFKLYFNELCRTMKHFLMEPDDDKRLKKIENCLLETIQLVEKLGLEKTALPAEKKKVKKKYLSLLKELSLEQIVPVVNMKHKFCQVVQDDSKVLLEDIRKALIKTCYSNLIFLGSDSDPVSADELHQISQKMITGYALCFKPPRFFYQRFFNKYIGTVNGSLSDSFQVLSGSQNSLALVILKIFSDANIVADLLFKEQIAYAEQLLDTVTEQ